MSLFPYQHQAINNPLTRTSFKTLPRILDDAVTMLLNSLLVALLATAPIAVFAAPIASPGTLASPGDDL